MGKHSIRNREYLGLPLCTNNPCAYLSQNMWPGVAPAHLTGLCNHSSFGPPLWRGQQGDATGVQLLTEGMVKPKAAAPTWRPRAPEPGPHRGSGGQGCRRPHPIPLIPLPSSHTSAQGFIQPGPAARPCQFLNVIYSKTSPSELFNLRCFLKLVPPKARLQQRAVLTLHWSEQQCKSILLACCGLISL